VRNKYNLNTKWSQSGIKQSKTKGDTGTGGSGMDMCWLQVGWQWDGHGQVVNGFPAESA
jgi:hypothetical protein